MPQLLKCENLALNVHETEQICHVLRASLAVHMYALKDGRTRELLFQLFLNGTSLLLSSIVRGSYS